MGPLQPTQATGSASTAHGPLPGATPWLAPGVELAGELPGAGFAERQWLVQRDGRFIQVSELLYRVLEQIETGRSSPAIATELTARTPWRVTPDLVESIIATKLVPLGLVVREGEEAPVLQERRRSPLQIAARQPLLRRRVLRPVSSMLRHLYWPPLLPALLGAVGLAHVWTYSGGRMATGVREVLFRPGLMLVLLGLLLLGSVLHELGHASALRYGGGEARAIGVGLYFFYPVFYTDTTDAYRLGRLARIRTDLGGFYFHLLFAAILVGAQALSGVDWLLVPVLIINLDVLRQLLIPVVRFDGYWFLADLTGVPDFFSQMGPFLRRVLGRSGGPKLPPLRPVTRAVFGVYTLLAVGGLSALWLLIVTRAPDFAVTAWHSIQSKAQVLSMAVHSGEVLLALDEAAQIALFVPVLLGAMYVAYSTVYVVWRLTAAICRRGARARLDGRAASSEQL